MISFKNHIIFDKIDSWPNKILELIEKNERSIKRYFEEEKRSRRNNRLQNIHEKHWRNTVEKIDNVLNDHRIVGIHATKLLKNEIVDIQENGLRPLNKNFANQRVERAFNDGLISKELKCKLINKEELVEDIRKGKVFVFHCLSSLQDEDGFNKLFGYWGGESLYSYTNSKELKKIGIPCIVFTSIKINELSIYPKLSKRMLEHYFNDKYCPPYAYSTFEKKLHVLRIIKRDEKSFEVLTGIQNWNKPIDFY